MTPEIISPFRMPVQVSSLEDEGFRNFTVTNQDFVELPGCAAITEVRLNGQTFPPSQDHKVPVDTTETNFKTLRVGNYQLVDQGRGPVLLRGMNSNDGKWQLGAVLSVKGEWSDTKAADAPKGAKADAKAADAPST